MTTNLLRRRLVVDAVLLHQRGIIPWASAFHRIGLHGCIILYSVSFRRCPCLGTLPFFFVVVFVFVFLRHDPVRMNRLCDSLSFAAGHFWERDESVFFIFSSSMDPRSVSFLLWGASLNSRCLDEGVSTFSLLLTTQKGIGLLGSWGWCTCDSVFDV